MRLIKNGQVLIDNRLEKKDILIDEGKIIQIDKTEKHRIQIKENTVLLRKNPLQQN